MIKILVVLVCFLIGWFAMAANMVVGVEENNYFPIFESANGEYKASFAKDLLDAFAKSKGLTFTYKPLPINRLFLALVNGEIDFKYPDNPVWQQQVKASSKIYYSDNVLKFVDGIMQIEGKLSKSTSELKVVGTVLGFTPWPYYDLINAKKIDILSNPTPEGLMQQALSGRVDGAYINVDVARFILEKLGKKESLKFNKDLPFADSETSLSSKKHPKIIQEFNEFLKSNTQLVADLKSKYKIN